MLLLLQSYGFILVIPSIVFIISLLLRSAAGPFWLYADPSYAYLFNGLHIFKRTNITHIDHPGTPLQLIITLIICLKNIGHSANETIHQVLANPEHYLQLTHLFLIICLFITSTLLSSYIYFRTQDKCAALLSQLPTLQLITTKSFESPWAVITTGANVNCEILLMSIINLFTLALFMLYFSKTSIQAIRSTILFGCMAGLGLATKLTFLPLVLAAVFIVSGKNKFLFIGSCLLSFLTWTLPIQSQYIYFWKWVTGVFHGTLYASQQGLLDGPHFLTHFINEFLPNYWAFFLIVLIILITTSINIFKNPLDKNYKFTWVLSFFILFGFTLAITHYSAHYLLTSIALLGPIMILFYLKYFYENKPLKKYVYLFILVFAFLNMAHFFRYVNQLHSFTKHVTSFYDGLKTDFPNAVILTTADKNLAFNQDSALLFGNEYCSDILLNESCSHHESKELKDLYPKSFYLNVCDNRTDALGICTFDKKVFADDLLNIFPYVILVDSKSEGKHTIDLTNEPYSAHLIKTSFFADAFLLTDSTEKLSNELFDRATIYYNQGKFPEAFTLALKSKELHYQPDGKLEYLLVLIYQQLKHP